MNIFSVLVAAFSIAVLLGIAFLAFTFVLFGLTP